MSSSCWMLNQEKICKRRSILFPQLLISGTKSCWSSNVADTLKSQKSKHLRSHCALVTDWMCVRGKKGVRNHVQTLRQKKVDVKVLYRINVQINRLTVRHKKAVQTSKQIRRGKSDVQLINRQQVKTWGSRYQAENQEQESGSGYRWLQNKSTILTTWWSGRRKRLLSWLCMLKDLRDNEGQVYQQVGGKRERTDEQLNAESREIRMGVGETVDIWRAGGEWQVWSWRNCTFAGALQSGMHGGNLCFLISHRSYSLLHLVICSSDTLQSCVFGCLSAQHLGHEYYLLPGFNLPFHRCDLIF